MAEDKTDKHAQDSGAPDAGASHGYEIRDVHMSVVVVGIASLAILCVVSLVAIWWMVGALDRIPGERAAEVPAIDYGRLLPPEPRLQADPPRDLEEFLAREEEFLTTYGWINREEGIVRVPVGRAMTLIAEQGLPEWDDPNAPATTGPAGAPEPDAELPMEESVPSGGDAPESPADPEQ